ncbi:MAG TPA: glycosyltransferase family 4 protein [Thermoanaerobaculia bacterium]|nr:glycosyltransferase family 4 protein [Thermoanaerobaculia bacterium]
MHLVLTPHYPPRRFGGIEKVVQQLARGLRDAGERVVVGALDLEGPAQLDRDGDIVVVRVPCHAATKDGRTAAYFDAQPVLATAMRPFLEADTVVHAHDWFVAPAAFALGAPVLAIVHGVKRAEAAELHERHQRIHDMQRELVQRADAVFCASQAARRMIARHLGSDRAQLLRFGIDENAEGPIATNERRILYLGRLQPDKGIDTLLRAFRDIEDAELRILGRGPLQPSGERVTVIPFTSDERIVDEELRRASVVVVPSHFEAAGMVVLEAMCRETPVIVSRCGGPEEIVRDGETGRLFNPGDAAELARLLRIAFERPVETRAMARSGRIDVEQRFRWKFAVETLRRWREPALAERA